MSTLLLKKTQQFSAMTLIVGAVILLSFLFTDRSGSQVPSDSGTLGPNGSDVVWNGNSPGLPPSSEGETTCVEDANCETFKLTLSGTPANWSGKKARIEISWTDGNNDYDVYVHKGSASGPLVGSSAAGGPGPEIVELDPNVPSVGTGDFYVHVVYWLVIPDQYQAVASAVGGAPTPTPTPTGTPTPTPAPPGTPRYQIYDSPPGVADDAGEPSIGINWNTEQSFSNSMFTIPNGGTSLFYGGFLTYMLKITFDDCSSPANAVWEQKPVTLPSTPRAFGDPILFTDHGWPGYTGMPASLGTGRTFVCQLEGLTPAGSTIEYTDNDGDSFSPSQGGAPSAIDHETIGGGPFHTPVPPGLLYPNAVYYASQEISDARSELSLDGGITFPVQSVMFTALDCAGLHGHLKVAPDGTAFVPDKGCAAGGVPLLLGGEASVIVSEDNGLTWTIRTIDGATTSGNDDPSVGVATDSNTIFLGYQAENGQARIAVSHDKGQTWAHDTDVGAQVGVKNCAFPAVVAGDGEQNGPNTSRAAFAFFGTTTGGTDADQPTFPGVWYLYIATTFDGGQTWTTVNATPNDPIQRGGICGDGACRNLLDFFDASIDKQGRVLVGGEDGCIGGCVNGGPNSFTAKAFIARQSGGKRMYAQFDPNPPEPVLPGAPMVSGGVDSGNTTVTLTWPAPDDGGAPITAYRIYRATNESGPYTKIATVKTPGFVDTTFNQSLDKFYRVRAVNKVGQGPFCHNFHPEVVILPDPCKLPGVLVINDLNQDGSDKDSGANMPVDPRVNVKQLYIAEPFISAGVEQFFFTLQVAPSNAGSAPPNSQWFIVWNRQMPDMDFDRWYVAMRTDTAGTPSFEYGKFGVPLDPLNPSQNANTPVKVGDADSGSYNPLTGVIRIVLSKSKAENVQPGDDLAGLNVRTYFNRPDPGQRSQNNASDITDDSSYSVVGNASCAPVPDFINAVSRKKHGNGETFDVLLEPMVPKCVGIECRKGTGSNSDTHKVVFLFGQPVTFNNATVTPGPGGTASVVGTSTNGNEVTVTVKASNAQIATVNLLGVSAGGPSSDFSARLGLLLADVTMDRKVTKADVRETRKRVGQDVDETNFREDVTKNGAIDSQDVSVVKSQLGNSIP